MASEQDIQHLGTDLLKVQPENETGFHPLDMIVAVAALTQKVNGSNLAETIEIAKNMGLEKIDEIERLVNISSKISVIEPSANGEGGTSDEDKESEVVVAGQSDASAQGNQQEEVGKIEGATESESDTKDVEKYSDQFKDMPKYQLRNGKPSQAKIFNDAVVQFIDKKHAEGDLLEIKPSTGDKGSALSALVRLMKNDPEIDVDLDQINGATRQDAFNRLAAHGYLDVDHVVVGDNNYRRIVAIRPGTPAAEDLKKN